MKFKFIMLMLVFVTSISLVSFLVSADTDVYIIQWSVPETEPYYDNLINHTHNVNTTFTYDLDATDTDGISCFVLNDTSVFDIDCTGVIGNVTALDTISIYNLNVTVNDTLDNKISGLFYINVTAITIRNCDGIAEDDLVLSTEHSPYVQLCYAIKFAENDETLDTKSSPYVQSDYANRF